MQRGVSLSWESFLNSFIYPFEGPLQEMWFVAVIFLFFCGRKIWEITLLNGKCSVVFFFVALLLHLIPVNMLPGFLAINRAAHFLIYFYIGILLATDKGNQFIPARLFSIFLIGVTWGITLFLNSELLTALAGCFFFWGLAVWADKKFSITLFSSFRDYTYQIFLIGIFVQIGVKICYRKLAVPDSYGIFYVLCILLGLYIPVLISKLFQRVNNRYLNLLLGL